MRLIFTKKRGETAISLPLKHAGSHCAPRGNLLGRRGAACSNGAQKTAAASDKLPQPIFCVKSRRALRTCRASTKIRCFSRYPDLRIHSPRTPSQSSSNDRLSPCAGASTLTVAVPFGICTRFPFNPAYPPGLQGTKTVVHFRNDYIISRRECQQKQQTGNQIRP